MDWHTIAQYTMWLFAGLSALAGLLLLANPTAVRHAACAIHTNRRIRIVAVLAVIVGAAFYARAHFTSLVIPVRVIGAALFVAGGVGLLLPQVAIIINEWILEHRDSFIRALCLVYFILAAVFYFAGHIDPMAVSPEVVNEVTNEAVNG